MSFEAALHKRFPTVVERDGARHTVGCVCFWCLRDAGLTPPRKVAGKHPDALGRKHRVDDGATVTPPPRNEVS